MPHKPTADADSAPDDATYDDNEKPSAPQQPDQEMNEAPIVAEARNATGDLDLGHPRAMELVKSGMAYKRNE